MMTTTLLSFADQHCIAIVSINKYRFENPTVRTEETRDGYLLLTSRNIFLVLPLDPPCFTETAFPNECDIVGRFEVESSEVFSV